MLIFLWKNIVFHKQKKVHFDLNPFDDFLKFIMLRNVGFLVFEKKVITRSRQ